MKRFAFAALLAAAGPAAAACRPDTAEFMWDSGAARFAVEIADDEAERALGLMNRDSLGSGSGMLFVYDAPSDVAFWMKNTLIPLDMIFLDDAGRVTRVHENAVPGDLTPIPGPKETFLVLEIKGGLAARLGLGEGAVLRHPALDPARAAWPCE